MTRLIETSDAAANSSTLYEMAAGDEFFGNLSLGERDWVAVTLVSGQTYSFGAMGLGALKTGVADPILRLRDESGAILARNDDGGPGTSSKLVYTAATSGTFYIEAEALQSGVEGGYGLVVSEGRVPSFGVEMGAGILYRPGLSWADTPETGVTLTWAVRGAGPAFDAQGNATPFIPLSADQISAAKEALANYEDVANVIFNQVNPSGTSKAATILMGAYNSTTDGAGAFAYYPGQAGPRYVAGDLWLNNDSVSRNNLPFGSYDYFTILHELGHAMGLAHPGDYNAAPGVSITYENNAQFVEDSNQFSVMSYFNATDTEADAPTNYCDTLMLYDIYALQQMYGANHTTRAGNDTYGFKSNLGGPYNFILNSDPLMCIWDGAGTDTLNLSGFGGKQVIDLNPGALSDVGGFKGNLSIALGAEIENAVGGRGADQIYGNALGNVLKGGRGSDILVGGAGDDFLSGQRGADGFIFVQGDGRDMVMDFNISVDILGLSAGLWGGVVKTAAEVLNEFVDIISGAVVFDFGTDELTLRGITTTAGLESQITIS